MKHYLSILLTISVLCSCGAKKESATDATKTASESTTIVTLTDAQLDNAGLTTAKATYENMPNLLTLNGTIDVPPQNLVSISFPLGGYLKQTGLLPGMEIRKGQVIAVLEDPAYVQLQQDYLMAKAKIEYLKGEFERQKELSEAEAASKKNFQLAKSDYEVHLAMLSGLGEKLSIIGINPLQLQPNNISRTVLVHAPIHGFVSKVNVNIGKYVTPADVMFEIVETSDIHAALTVFEKDIQSIKKGQQVTIYAADQPTIAYAAEVILVTKNVDENKAGIIHCHFENTDNGLLPGMFVHAAIALDQQTLPAVPANAVLRYQNKHYIFEALAGGHSFELKEVVPGQTVNGKTALKNTNILWGSAQIVVTNAYTLLGVLKNVAED